MSKTTFTGYVPSLKAKHKATITEGKAIESKGGSIRYTIQGLYDGRKTFPKTVTKADFEGVYGFDAKAAEAVVIMGKKEGKRGMEYIGHKIGDTDKTGFTPDIILPTGKGGQKIGSPHIILSTGKGGQKIGSFDKLKEHLDNYNADTVGSPSPASVEPPAPSDTPFPQEPSNENFSAEVKEAFLGFGKDDDEEEEEEEKPKEQEFTVVLQEGDRLELTDIEEEDEVDSTQEEEDNGEDEAKDEKEAENTCGWDECEGQDYCLHDAGFGNCSKCGEKRGLQELFVEDDVGTCDYCLIPKRYDGEKYKTVLGACPVCRGEDGHIGCDFCDLGYCQGCFDEHIEDGEANGYDCDMEALKGKEGWGAEYKAVSAKITRPVKEEEKEEEEEEGMSTLTKVGLGAAALAVGVAVFGAEGVCVCGIDCVCDCGCAESGVCNCGESCPCDCGCGVNHWLKNPIGFPMAMEGH